MLDRQAGCQVEQAHTVHSVKAGAMGIQARKWTKINFWGSEIAGWGGVFHAKGWWSKSSFPPSSVVLEGFKREGTWDVP